MNFKTILMTALLMLALCFSVAAQQSPIDRGEQDYFSLVLSQPEAGANDSTFVVQGMMFTDSNQVISAGLGFSWDNPNVVLDSAALTQTGFFAFDFQPFFYYKNSTDSSNAYQWFQMSVTRLFRPGLAPGPDPRHIANFYFHITDWSVNDTICIDSVHFSGSTLGTFVDLSEGEYPVGWNGPYCVGDPNAPTLGTLEVAPANLTFEGLVGGPNPIPLSFDVSELDGGTIGYTAVANQPWIALVNASGTTPGTVDVGVDLTGLAADVYTGQISVTSPDAGNTAVVEVTLTVTQPNQPPVLSDIADESVDEDTPLEINVSATDPDGDGITLSAAPLPAGANFTDNGDGTGTFNWTPDFDQANIYHVVFSASDGEFSDEDTVTITVNDVNRAPVLTEVGPFIIEENENLMFGVSATDPDSDALTLTAEFLPTGATFQDNGDNTGSFDWTPADGQADGYIVWIIASDGGLADTILVDIDVLPDEEFALLQVIHNAADPAANIVDVWVNGSVFIEDFAFRTATPFVNVPAGVELTVGVSAPNAGAPLVEFAPVTLTADVAYVAVANGVLDDTMFEANPDGRDINLTVFTRDNVQTTGTSGGNIDFIALHGATDAPTVDVIARGVTTLVNDAAYGDITDYISVPAASYILDVTPGADTATVVASFQAELSAVGGRAAVVFASGFLTPDNDQNGAPFGLFAALDDGTVVEFPPVVPPVILTVSPDTLTFVVNEGDISFPTLSFDVDEISGETIDFSVYSDTDAVWISLGDTLGTTPATISVNVMAGSLDPGVYEGNIYVASDEADNSPVAVHVNLIITECPTLVPSEVEYDLMVFEGETATFSDTINITGSGETNIDWESVPGDYFTFDPATGVTPSLVDVMYERLFDDAGSYSDTAWIVAPPSEFNTCSSSVLVIVNTVVNRPPSADTVIVVNTPAVPGMHVGVPVTFSNSCPLNALGIALTWPEELGVLDSVSFDGSAIDYLMNKTVSITDNLVEINASVDGQSQVPIGSEQLWATLFFSIYCEMDDGAYPIILADVEAIPGEYNVYFDRDCSEGSEIEIPEYIEGNVIVGTASNFVCGYVVDPEMNEIEGATVELWPGFPNDGPTQSMLSTSIGSFAFDSIMAVPFDLFAYKEGYYPGLVEDINFGEKGIIIVLEPVQELTPTSEWVDYYCPEQNNLYFGALVPNGSVVEAFTQDGLLVGQMMVTNPGQYGFMPVYRANEDFGDDGAVTGDMISFHINGYPAIADGNTVYPSEYAQVPVCLEVRGSAEKECDLVEGWNLISWNVDTDTDDILDVLGPIMSNVDVILGFEGGGRTFDPDLQEFSTLWQVDHYSGYWIRIKDGAGTQTLTVTGLPVPVSTPIPVYTGWNLVSYLPEADIDPDLALQTIMENLIVAYGFTPGIGIEIYRPTGGEFNTMDLMSTCHGYWVKSEANDLLIYPDGEQPPVNIPFAASFGKAVPETEPGVTATTSWINLYSSNLTVDGRSVSAGAVITAHAADDDMQIGRFEVTVDGKFGFMPVYADAAGQNAIGVQPGDKFYLKVNGVETTDEFEWTSNGSRVEVAALTTGNSSLPASYSLDQNYPNPFNPTTTINFSLPSAGQAKIEVFNILGRLIATPFDGMATAGENSVVWDGTDRSGDQVASGVYFYRLSADTYVETRKMMLLK